MLLIGTLLGAFVAGPLTLFLMQPTIQIKPENVQPFGNNKFYFTFDFKKVLKINFKIIFIFLVRNISHLSWNFVFHIHSGICRNHILCRENDQICEYLYWIYREFEAAESTTHKNTHHFGKKN